LEAFLQNGGMRKPDSFKYFRKSNRRLHVTMTLSKTPVVLSSLEAANLILLSRVRLHELVKAGWIKQLAPNRFDTTEVVQGYIRFLRDEERRGSKTATLSAVQTARAREIEMRIAREEHTLIALDEALDVLDEIIGGMKAEFDGLAASITRDPALRTTIEVKVDEIYRRHADGLEQKARALRTSGASLPADTENDAGRVGDQESPIPG
jgi:hypothetical protein